MTKPVDAGRLRQTIESLICLGNRPPELADYADEDGSDEAANSAATQSAAEAPPIDWPKLLARTMSDDGFARSLLEKFARRADEDVAQIKSAAAANDIAEVARRAHVMKGMTGSLAATAVHVLASELEQRARANETQHIAPLIEKLSREVGRCVEHIQTEHLAMAANGQ